MNSGAALRAGIGAAGFCQKERKVFGLLTGTPVRSARYKLVFL
jgi:hypothetical protein